LQSPAFADRKESWTITMRLNRPLPAPAFVVSALVAIAVAGSARAQSMNANSAAYNAGYGRVAGQENQPVEVGIRDANGNLVIVDGVIQTGVDQSSFGSFATSGAGETVSGAGGGASAIGNNLEVVTQGSYNTVIVNSQQTNTGDVSASTSH
jgi:holdfast attachment protein HfaA